MAKCLILYIDATALHYNGGGATHLYNFIKYNTFDEFSKVRVYANKKLISVLPKNHKINYYSHFLLNFGLIQRLTWVFIIFNPQVFFKNKIRILNVSNNIIFNSNTITVSHNLLPFDHDYLKSSRDYKLKCKYLLLRYYQLLAFYFSKNIIFVSNSLLEYVKYYYTGIQNKSLVIYNASDIKYNYKIINNKVTNIFYVSSAHEYKNQLNVVKSFDLLFQKNKDLFLYLIGDFNNNYGRDVLSYIDRLESKHNIKFYKTQDPSNLNLLLSNCDIFISASSSESFGINILDGMCHSLPIACSSIKTYKELFTNYVMFFDPKDINSIQEALNKLISDYSLRTKLSKSGYEYNKNFNWESSSNRLYKVILSTL